MYNLPSVLFLLLGLAANVLNVHASFNLSVGVLYTATGSDVTSVGSRAWRAQETYNVTQIFRQQLLADSGVSGITQIEDIHFTYADVGSGSNSTYVTQVARSMCEGSLGDFNFILSPFSSGVTQTVAIACDPYDEIVLAGGAASEAVFSCLPSNAASYGCTDKVVGQRRFPGLFGVINLSSQYMEPVVQLTKLNGAESIAFFHQSGLFSQTMCEQAFLSASFFDFDKVYDLYPLDHTSDSSFEGLFEQLESNKPDVVVGCVLNTACTEFMTRAYDRNYLPNFLALSVCVGTQSVEETLGSKFNYIAGPVQWDPRCTDSGCTEQTTSSVIRLFNQTNGVRAPEEFDAAYRAYSGVSPSYQAAGSMATLYSLAYAVERAQSNATHKTLEALNDISQPSYYGLIEGSRLGANEAKEMLVIQYDQNNFAQIVYPLSTDTSGVIYPIPTWDERVYTKKLFNTESEKVMLAMVVINSVMILTLIGILIAHRGDPVIKAVSVLFVTLSLLGLLMLDLSMLTWGLENNEITCGCRPWLLGIGFTLFFGPIAVKLWRIMKIFSTLEHAVNITSLKVDDGTLLKFLGYLMIPTLAILVLWQGIDPLSPEIIETDPIRPSKNYTTCRSGSFLWSVIMLVYCMVLLSSLVVLSFQTRKSWSKFKESQQMAFALYGFCICVLVMVVLQITGNIKKFLESFRLRTPKHLKCADLCAPPSLSPQSSRAYRLDVRTIFGTIAIWTWCGALYGPKLWQLTQKDKEVPTMVSLHEIKGTPRMKMPHSKMQEAEEVRHGKMQFELEELRDKCEQLEGKLRRSDTEKKSLSAECSKLKEQVIKLVDEKVSRMDNSKASMTTLSTRSANSSHRSKKSPTKSGVGKNREWKERQQI
eukprot:jgi/Bigna1/75589/fgenesh1_pg.35_\